MIRLLSVFILMLMFSSVGKTSPTVIANSFVVEKNLTQRDIINIFTRKKIFWNSGHKITVYVKPIDSIEHRIFAITVLNLTPFKYKSLLESITYSGFNTSVVELASDGEMVYKLSITPYSIGYVNSSILVNDGENVIKIQYD